MPPADQRPLLFLAPQWTGSNGGDTVNRELVRALAERGHTVFVRVAEEVFERPHPNLTVDGLEPVPGVPLRDRGNFFRTERLPGDVAVVFGHARLTGGAAQYLQRHLYPDAARVQFVHADSGRLDVFRNQFGTPEQRDRALAESRHHELEERDLLSGTVMVAGVGPLLSGYARQLAEQCPDRPPVYDMFPGVEIHPQPVWTADRERVQLLLLGRVEDKIKGTEIAVDAVRELHRRGHRNVDLTLRGASPQTVAQTAAKLSQLAGTAVRVKPFTVDRDEIAADIRGSAVVLMPSRLEGFGLVATEAAGHGVPVLVSGCSGVGHVFRDPAHFPDRIAEPFVVPMEGSEPAAELAQRWADRLEGMIGDLPAARGTAAAVQQYLAANYTWPRVAERFAQALDLDRRTAAVVGGASRTASRTAASIAALSVPTPLRRPGSGPRSAGPGTPPPPPPPADPRRGRGR